MASDQTVEVVDVDAAERGAGPDRLATWFVGAVWVVTAGFAAAWTSQYGRRHPFSDDWDIVRVMTGQRSFSLGWLWSFRTDHRPVVPRLTGLGFGTLGNGNFIGAVWFDFVLLAGGAALAILAMRRVRGRTIFADAFFPLLMLSIIQPAFNWGYEVNHVTVAVVALVILFIMMSFGLDVPVRWLWVATAIMPLLLGVGAPGLAALPGILAWLVVCALRLRRVARGHGTAILIAVGLIVIGFGLYFIDYSGAEAGRPTLRQVVEWSLHLGAAAGGARAGGLWPLSGLMVFVGVVATAVVLGRRILDSASGSRDRGQAIALALFGFSACLLLVAISWGRSASGWQARRAIAYSALYIPLLSWAYVVWDRCAPRLRTAVPSILLILAAGGFVLNAEYMRRYEDRQAVAEAAFRRDACRLEPDALARRHASFLLESASPREILLLADDLREMRRDGMVPFSCS